MIIASIDVTLLDKARFKEVKCRDGHTAKYCEIVLIETPASEYGDFMAKQGVTKEERARRVEMPILGNAKHVGGKSSQESEEPRQQRRERPAPARRERIAPAPQQRRRQADPDAPYAEDQQF